MNISERSYIYRGLLTNVWCREINGRMYEFVHIHVSGHLHVNRQGPNEWERVHRFSSSA